MEIFYENKHTIEFVEELLIEYVTIQVETLNLTLKQNGIKAKNLRQKICEEFFFDFSNFIDDGWIEKDKKVFSPLICFAEFQNQDSFGIEEMTKLHVPTTAISLHESAFGNSDWYFEEMSETTSEINHSDKQ